MQYAVYKPGSDRFIYFYSFGSEYIKAGYYLYDKETKKYQLLFKYASDIRTYEFSGEYINGFDIRPDGKKLIYPISMTDAYPIAVEYDLETKTRDMLKLKFEPTTSQPCLWLRYIITTETRLFIVVILLLYLTMKPLV